MTELKTQLSAPIDEVSEIAAGDPGAGARANSTSHWAAGDPPVGFGAAAAFQRALSAVTPKPSS